MKQVRRGAVVWRAALKPPKGAVVAAPTGRWANQAVQRYYTKTMRRLVEGAWGAPIVRGRA